MSGHSKWSTIKRQKGTQDQKRGQIFTKLSNAITLAAKHGGVTAESNFRLRLAMDRARAANMPKENIERAIERAKGAAENGVEELMYEGFAPGGVAVIIEAVTDNKQRTVSNIKNIFEKSGGTLGSSGSVSYLFKRKGEIIAKKNNESLEELLNKGITAGADDMEEEGDSVFYYVEPSALFQTKKALEEQGVVVENAEIVYIPLSDTKQDSEIENRVLSIVESLEELDDVQKVYTNLG